MAEMRRIKAALAPDQLNGRRIKSVTKKSEDSSKEI